MGFNRRLLLSAASVVTVMGIYVVSAGCTGEVYDEDDRRGKAGELPVGQVVTDELDPPDDKVDWKQVIVPGEGYLTVTVFWDNADIDSRVAVTNDLGDVLREVPRDSRKPRDQIIVEVPKQSFYFVRVSAKQKSEGSTYSVQASFSGQGPNTKDPGPGGGVPIPEFLGPIDPGSEGDEFGS